MASGGGEHLPTPQRLSTAPRASTQAPKTPGANKTRQLLRREEFVPATSEFAAQALGLPRRDHDLAVMLRRQQAQHLDQLAAGSAVAQARWLWCAPGTFDWCQAQSASARDRAGQPHGQGNSSSGTIWWVRLRSEAAGRQMSVVRLVQDLLDVIVTDKLTAAILDN